MASHRQVIAQIRFGIEQLSAKNAHHEFEHLCRHLTKKRICSNILPSTGPVSVGGDLGRDFQTFRTYLRGSPISKSVFLGLVTDKVVVFACSLQKKSIGGKIKSDINKIMSHDYPIDSIYFFSALDIPVSKQENVKKWAKDEHDVELVVFDGQAIAEHLADREIFWIAVEFLSIPLELYPNPPIDKSEEWYNIDFKKWKEKKIPALTYGEFIDVRTLARFSKDSEKYKQHLPFWIGVVENFIHEEAPRSIRRRAIYEVVVLTLRGLGHLEGREKIIKDFFKDIIKLDDVSELQDATTLLTYCINAWKLDVYIFSADTLQTWYDKLVLRLEQLIEGEKSTSKLCFFYDIRGQLAIFSGHKILSEGNIEETFEWWYKLTDIVKDAPLYPLERFSDCLTILANNEDFGLHPRFHELTQLTDDLLSVRHAGSIAAKKCISRSKVFIKNKRYLRALDELHNAKIKWFAEETLFESIQAMLTIGKCYVQLGLAFAAKYYFLGAAFTALSNQEDAEKPLVPHTMFLLADLAYFFGFWMEFIETTHIALHFHFQIRHDPEDLEKHGDYKYNTYLLSMLLAIAEKYDVDLYNSINYLATPLDPLELLDEIMPHARESVALSKSELWKEMEDQIQGRPFCDVGIKREVCWEALGIEWKVYWDNDYELTATSENFLAILQIMIADLAEKDLCLLKSNVEISIELSAQNKVEIKRIESNVQSEWKIYLPKPQTKYSHKIGELQFQLVNLIGEIVWDLSLLGRDEFFSIFKNMFSNGLPGKVFIAQPYDILFKEFVGKEIFEKSDRKSKETLEKNRRFRFDQNQELKWFNGTGPTYSKEKSTRVINNRYKEIKDRIPNTLKNLSSNPKFRAVILQMRSKGWLDWHILCAIYNIAVDYRIRDTKGTSSNFEEFFRTGKNLIKTKEQLKDEPVPEEEFNIDRIQLFHKPFMLSVLKTWNLDFHQLTPNLEALDHFLTNRYNYWIDDVEHIDPFVSVLE